LDRWFVIKALASANLTTCQHAVLRNLFAVVQLKRSDLDTQS
jgi:hypothetical protein